MPSTVHVKTSHLPRRTLYSNFYLSQVLRITQVSEPFESVLSIQTQSVIARLGMDLRVLFLPLSGYGWTPSSLLLLLLMGEFTSHMSLSEFSIQVPTSMSESFRISLTRLRGGI